MTHHLDDPTRLHLDASPQRDGPTPFTPRQARVALVAHDNCKAELLAWAEHNRDILRGHVLHATGTTGTMLQYELGFDVHRFKSGPLGGDLQIGARVAEGAIDLLIFFWDPLEPQPHDPDVKALLRIATLANVPVACNRATADHLVTSPLLGAEHSPVGTPDPDGSAASTALTDAALHRRHEA